jgi:hypothetical protein
MKFLSQLHAAKNTPNPGLQGEEAHHNDPSQSCGRPHSGRVLGSGL